MSHTTARLHPHRTLAMAPKQSSTAYSTASCCIERPVLEDGKFVIRFFCKLCDGSVAQKSDFQRHMRIHSGEGLFYCTWEGCTRTQGFVQKSNMKQHVKSVHLGMQYRCPHSYVAADGMAYPCDHLASDPSGLTRHRSTSHGWDVGDDPEKVAVPTPEGATFPNSKYYRGKRKADEGAVEAAKDSTSDSETYETAQGPIRRPKREKTMPTPSSSRTTSSSSRHAPKRKQTRRTSAPAHTQEQAFEWNAMLTIPASPSPATSTPSPITSTPSPITVPDVDLGFANMQPQPAAGMNAVEPFAFNPSLGPAQAPPAPVESFMALLNSDVLLNPQAQTHAGMGDMSFVPPLADFNFNFNFEFTSPLPAPSFDGTVDPSVFLAQPSVPVQLPPANLNTNPGLTSTSASVSAPNSHFYGMGWQAGSDYSTPTPGSSRESTASPDSQLEFGTDAFTGMPVPGWTPYSGLAMRPVADEPAYYNGFFNSM